MPKTAGNGGGKAAPAKQLDWFGRIAKIATEQGEVQYSADDVRAILKAWRTEYTARKKEKKAAEKAAAAQPAAPVKKAKVVAAVAEPAEEE
jgi:hypothetical protein